ncbi:MAG: hypothetical protein QM742_16590 [Aquabacterium sp.]
MERPLPRRRARLLEAATTGLAGELAKRLCGSADLYQHDGRRPIDSINLVTVHDGFTLHDLVSYNDKHNEANREDNRDGETHNLSWNCGAEGDDRRCAHPRSCANARSATCWPPCFFSQGTPLLLAGDEMGRTQQGNNNAYCQDNEISWLQLGCAQRRNHAGLRQARDRFARIPAGLAAHRFPHRLAGCAGLQGPDLARCRRP